MSFALGAFFAGMMLRESEYSHRAAEESLPLRDAFAVLFFVSVGMLFDPRVLLDQPLQVAGGGGHHHGGQDDGRSGPGAGLAGTGHWGRRLVVGASLAQIGEFSFILGALGAGLGVLPPEAQSLIVAGALLSIAFNPLLFSAVDPLRRWILQRSSLARALEDRVDPLAELPMSTDRRFLARQVVLVGYGRVGREIAQALRQRDIPFVVVDCNRERVEALRAAGTPAVSGDAADPAVLIQAHIAEAGLLVVAASESTDARPMITTARTLNPGLPVIVRAPNAEEAALLMQEGAHKAVHQRGALATVMTRDVLDLVDTARGAARVAAAAARAH